jgi:hypothetical protein
MKNILDIALTVFKSLATLYVSVFPAVVTATVMLDISVLAFGNTNEVLAAENRKR